MHETIYFYPNYILSFGVKLGSNSKLTKNKNLKTAMFRVFFWLRRLDLNQRPSGYEVSRMGNLIRYYDSISTVYSSLINITISFHTIKIIKFLAGVAVYVAVQKQNQLFPKAISISTFHYLNTSHMK